MRIPFIGGSYAGRSLNVNAQRSINFFEGVDTNDAKDQISLYGTPGLDLFSALMIESATSKVRQLHVMRDVLYVIVGSAVYSVTLAGAATSLGAITTATGNVFMADNGTQIMIVDGTVNGHYIEAGALNNITDTDFPAADSVTFQDGYFIITELNTGRIWKSALYNANAWDALDYATAEAKPDYAKRVISTMRELWIFGETTIEPYYNSGNTDFPFERIQGSTLPVGIASAASIVDIAGTFFWLSNKGIVLKNSGYNATPISTPAIDYQISTYTTIDNAIGYTFTAEGHMFYVLAFPTHNITWLYDLTTGVWSEWQSYYNKDPAILWGRHRSNCCVRFGNKEIVGDYENGNLYILNMSTYTDNGQYIRHIRTGQCLAKDLTNVVYHQFAIDFEAGVGLIEGVQGENPLAALEWSNDGGHTWSNAYTTSIGEIGEYGRRAIWNKLGAGRSRIFRVTISDPVKIAIHGAYAEVEALTA
jgi:hypothetical protein